ncbi:type IV secretory system conjugative DNA transfer family protein [Hyphomicrobium sp. GJ21]|uniref:type IV secretory system conjugative DNA transfer family protein n=1 Tax=Hyphomicrobium sp. GJ21 TaxID=113574 RepID=UPI000AA336E8|nr:type IV secretory system conjugative DNA transfer family protein [Hyphomicrobium sp. GJ21]
MSPVRTQPKHGLLLGWAEKEKGGFQKPVWAEGEEGHLITVAPTGAGKGVGCIIPALLTWRGPAIVIDPKGENYAVTARRRRDMGQKVHVLDPFGVTDCIQRASLNPFDMLGPLKQASYDDMRVLAHAVIQEKVLSTKNDPYWDSRAASLVTDAIEYCVDHLIKPTLMDVRTVIENYDRYSVCATSFSPAPVASAHHGILEPFAPLGMGTERTRTSITSTAMDQLNFITGGAVANSLFHSTIDLKKVERGDPITIYLVLPPNKLFTHAKLLRLWLITLLGAIGRREAAPKLPTLMLVDEAAQLGEVKEITTAITLMRGYGVKVWTFWQDLTQLAKVYPHDWQSILNNSAFHQYFGASTPMAARVLQEYLADTCPRPITSLKNNQLALYRPGHKGTVARMPNYLTDAMFAGQFDANPFYTSEPELALVDEDYEVHEDKGGVLLHFPAREHT